MQSTFHSGMSIPDVSIGQTLLWEEWNNQRRKLQTFSLNLLWTQLLIFCSLYQRVVLIQQSETCIPVLVHNAPFVPLSQRHKYFPKYRHVFFCLHCSSHLPPVWKNYKQDLSWPVFLCVLILEDLNEDKRINQYTPHVCNGGKGWIDNGRIFFRGTTVFVSALVTTACNLQVLRPMVIL